MGFFSKIFNSNRIEDYCDVKFIEELTYSKNGTVFASRNIYFQKHFSIDNDNNLIEIKEPIDSFSDAEYLVPIHFSYLPKIGLPRGEILVEYPNCKYLESWTFNSIEEPFAVTRESIAQKITKYNYYWLVGEENDLACRQPVIRCSYGQDGKTFYSYHALKPYYECEPDKHLYEYGSDKILWHKKSIIPSFRPEGACVNWQQKSFKHNSLYTSAKGEDGKPLKRFLWVFDFETTGLDSEYDEILEIGLCIYEIKPLDFGNTIEEYSCLRKVRVPRNVEQLTGISQTDVDNDGLDDKTIIDKLTRLYEKYGENAIFASYNLYFDASFFLKFLKAHNQKLFFDWLDILTIARDRFEYPHKLGEIISRIINDEKSRNCYSCHDLFLLKSSVNSHRAIDDAKAACNLLLVMMHSFDDIAKYIGIIGHPLRYPLKFNCGLSGYWAHPQKGREKGKILSRVQFYKMEYPIYFVEKRDVELSRKYYKDTLNEISMELYVSDCEIDIDYKLEFQKQ